MKKSKREVAALNSNNEAMVLERANEKQFMANYIDLVHLLAQGLDKAVDGEDLYFTLGMTRDRTGLLLVINWDKDKTYLVAGSLSGLSQECQGWLDD